MHLLLYNQLNPTTIPNFEKIRAYLEAGDFRSAEVKKVGDNLYRARLDKSNRLLFSLYRYQEQTYLLVLEWIAQHAYDKSRFLRRGGVIDEAKLPALDRPPRAPVEPLSYLNPHRPTFHLLDKVISFDEAQQAVYLLPPPLIVIGAAGSGKTALTLEKMKEATGELLYVTRSPYLVHHSRQLYYALDYENENQEINFLSFDDYLASIRVPPGRELPFRDFAQWFARHRPAGGIKDPYPVFEEFKGVITGPPIDSPSLSREAYLKLGIKQSIFSPAEREAVYDLFTKYLDFLRQQGYYDANLLSYQYLPLVEPRYDVVLVDEVQDLTTIQLQLILKSLRDPSQFILSGDSNQIVHPNFFSWAKLKTFFYQQESHTPPAELIRILHTSYRNSPEITDVANRILKLKNARFGSIDRESHYLVHSHAHPSGTVLLLPVDPALTRDLNQKTRQSTRFAIIVMHPEQKVAAKAHFQTPLVFSIQEAKGLEYDNIILYNFTSDEAERFREITRGVSPAELVGEDLSYARARDKSDKSLEIYKFHINALYVAVTRAVQNLYLVETDPSQRLFELLGLKPWEGPLALAAQGSSLEEWRQEAHKLELQGKQEQAEAIRQQILKQKPVPWPVLQGETLAALERQALQPGDKKAKLALFEYALVYQDRNRLNALVKAGFGPARQPEKAIKSLTQKYFLPYDLKQPTAVLRQVEHYGVDFRNPFNLTPLMIAARLGNEVLVTKLMELGAKTEPVNNVGFNAFQIALEQACTEPKYAAKKLAGVYDPLEPDSLVIQVDQRLIQLDNHLMEFLLLNLMIALFYTRLGDKVTQFTSGAFSSADFVDVLAPFPTRIVPERRKQRAYLSSILSKNEVDRADKYNRKLFRRLKRGHYIINPQLALRVEGEWCPIYELLSLELIGYRRVESDRDFPFDFNQHKEQQLQAFKARVRRLQAGHPLDDR